MMKKASSIFFILIANVILLAHAVIPHHHHENSVCIEKILGPDCDGHKHGISQNDCHHHNGNSSGNCVLNLALFFPSNQEKQECKFVNISDKHIQTDYNQAVPVYSEQISDLPEVNLNTQIPFNTSSHSDFVSASNYLRAPPVA
jgi:hypothetical protein